MHKHRLVRHYSTQRTLKLLSRMDTTVKAPIDASENIIFLAIAVGKYVQYHTFHIIFQTPRPKHQRVQDTR